MLILPAIDLISGNCVRLKEGAESTRKIYNDQPYIVAKQWQDEGARMIHVVNLDGAFGRADQNVRVIEKILSSVSIPIELGGGIRTLDDAGNWLSLGVARVIFGTVAVTQPQIVADAIQKYGSEQVVVGIDARRDKVAIEGWEKQTGEDVLTFARKMRGLGAERFIYTDIQRDGRSTGPNVERTAFLAWETQVKVIASGGISSVAHLQSLVDANEHNIEGAIIGTALYEGVLSLPEVVEKFQN
ncbi:MAG: 1-(5-phosphoribosyl)-5-[(5-phosphoribosylamino)methylideneamino]imidazole-4-carboxamide isomerase [Actinobacteria bacterium]|nr:1-(5-phosphoribosyl)-5-[(5-phosphoribosylamino)methylideneamino]imidazole-4-carboxamide isomerase [Actinomycetota bacterium]